MTRPYYHKRQRNNNKKLVLIIGIVGVSVFALIMILYPQISTQTNKIQSSLTSESNSIVSKFSDTSNSDEKTITSKIHDLINQQRTQQGLNSLIWNDQVAQIAKAHSNDMLNNDYFQHDDLQGNSPSDRLNSIQSCNNPSENIGWTKGYHLDQVAQKIVNDWMNSPEHRQNILRSSISIEGVGIGLDGEHVLITEDFC